MPWDWKYIVQSQNDPAGGSIVEIPTGKNGLITYRHSRRFIMGLLKNHKFKLLKEIEFIAQNFQMEGKPIAFSLYVTEG